MDIWYQCTCGIVSTFIPKHFLQNPKNPLVAKRIIYGRTLGPGLGYSYSVLVLAVIENWISCTRTLLVLVSSKLIVIVLVDKYSGTRTSTGTSTDIIRYICDLSRDWAALDRDTAHS